MQTPALQPSALLQQGIKAALAGEQAEACQILQTITQQEPDNEHAWLWLSSVSSSPSEAIACCRRVLQLNPKQELAHTLLKQILLQEAVANINQGQKDEARILLGELIELDDANELAWLWLTTLATDLAQARQYVMKVLAINPANERALAWQAQLCQVPSPDNSAPRTTTPMRRVAGTASFTILVVDDSPTVCRLVSLTLEKHGHQVVSAVNGLDALNKIKEVIPDLIFSDVNMPQLDGYQLCKMIRGNEVTKAVPVIMLSGKDGEFDKLRGQMVGATAYVTKPFEIDSLLQIIDQYCTQSS